MVRVFAFVIVVTGLIDSGPSANKCVDIASVDAATEIGLPKITQRLWAMHPDSLS